MFLSAVVLLAVWFDCCCRNVKFGSHRSDRERSRQSSQHRIHSPVHSTGRSPNTKMDSVHRESPTTSPRTRHMMSPGISARTRHGTAYRSRSPDDYKKSRDDMMKWTVESDYETSQQQHSASMVLLLLLLLFLFLFNPPHLPDLLLVDQVSTGLKLTPGFFRPVPLL